MAKDASKRAKKNIVNDKPANGKNKKSGNGFKNFFKKIGEGFRKLKSELKKVTWPNFKDVMKQTGVVLFVTLCFLIVIGCFDLGLSALLKLLVPEA